MVIVQNLTLFYYPKSDYIFPLNEDILIKPTIDGNKCRFTIESKLPNGVYLNEENGIIYGKCSINESRKEYIIICEKIWNKLEFRINLEWKYCFDETNKSKNVELDDNKTKIQISYVGFEFGYCFLNFKMESGIYTIIYSEIGSTNTMLCFSKEKYYKKGGVEYFNCNRMCKSKINEIIHKQNYNGDRTERIDNLIVDMNKRELYATRVLNNDRKERILVKEDLPSPLYPFVQINTLEVYFKIYSKEMNYIQIFTRKF